MATSIRPALGIAVGLVVIGALALAVFAVRDRWQPPRRQQATTAAAAPARGDRVVAAVAAGVRGARPRRKQATPAAAAPARGDGVVAAVADVARGDITIDPQRQQLIGVRL